MRFVGVGRQIELRQFDARAIACRLRLGGTAQQYFRLVQLFAIGGDAGFREKAFRYIEREDPLGGARSLPEVTACDSRSDQIVFEQVAVRLDVVRIERNSRIDLAAKLMRQRDQPEHARMPRLQPQNFGELAVILRYVSVQ